MDLNIIIGMVGTTYSFYNSSSCGLYDVVVYGQQ